MLFCSFPSGIYFEIDLMQSSRFCSAAKISFAKKHISFCLRKFFSFLFIDSVMLPLKGTCLAKIEIFFFIQFGNKVWQILVYFFCQKEVLGKSWFSIPEGFFKSIHATCQKCQFLLHYCTVPRWMSHKTNNPSSNGIPHSTDTENQLYSTLSNHLIVQQWQLSIHLCHHLKLAIFRKT